MEKLFVAVGLVILAAGLFISFCCPIQMGNVNSSYERGFGVVVIFCGIGFLIVALVSQNPETLPEKLLAQ